MKLTSSIICLVALFSVPASCIITATHNSKYDNGAKSINTVTCSSNLKARYPTLGKLPTKKIGGLIGAPCGTCWAINYDKAIVYALSIDKSDEGFQLSNDAVVALTAGKKQTLPGNLQITVTAADKALCGL